MQNCSYTTWTIKRQVWGLDEGHCHQTLPLQFPSLKVLGKEIEFGRPALYVDAGGPSLVLATCCEHLAAVTLKEDPDEDTESQDGTEEGTKEEGDDENDDDEEDEEEDEEGQLLEIRGDQAMSLSDERSRGEMMMPVVNV